MKQINKHNFLFQYNTDIDDVENIQNILDNAAVVAIAKPGIDSEEMVIEAPNTVALRLARKALVKEGFDLS